MLSLVLLLPAVSPRKLGAHPTIATGDPTDTETGRLPARETTTTTTTTTRGLHPSAGVVSRAVPANVRVCRAEGDSVVGCSSQPDPGPRVPRRWTRQTTRTSRIGTFPPAGPRAGRVPGVYAAQGPSTRS